MNSGNNLDPALLDTASCVVASLKSSLEIARQPVSLTLYSVGQRRIGEEADLLFLTDDGNFFKEAPIEHGKVVLDAFKGRRFSPHVTMARLHVTSVAQVTRYLADNALFASSEFEVDAFHIYSSILTRNGALHQIEASYSLIPPPVEQRE